MSMTFARQFNTAISLFTGGADAKLPLDALQVFLMIATNPGTNAKELLKKVPNISKSAMARQVTLLEVGENYRGGHGLGLVMGIPGDDDRRIKSLYLTARGRALLLKMLQAVNPSLDTSAADIPVYEELFKTTLRGGAR